MKQAIDRIGSVMRYGALGTALAILTLPMLLTLVLSFDSRDFLGPLPPEGVSLQWYRSFFTSDIYLRGLANSVIVAVCAVVISTTAGVMAALFLANRRFPGRDALLSFLMSPLVVPNLVVGFAILMAFTYYGIASALVRLIAGHVLLIMPFTIRTTLLTVEGVRRSLIEAALTLGARPAQVFWKIVFPLVRPGILAGAVFAASLSLQETSASIFLSNNRTYTLPVALLAQMRANFDLTIAAAAGVIVAAIVVAVLLLDRLVGLDRVTGRGMYSQH